MADIIATSIQARGPRWLILAASVSVSFLCVPETARADSTYSLVYSARLTSASGAPLEGPLDIDVKFYSAETEDTQLGNSFPFSNVLPSSGIVSLNMNLMPAQVQAIFGDGTESVFIELTVAAKTYPRQRYSFVPLALRVPVDEKTVSFGSDGKLGISLRSLPGANQFMTKNAQGELIWASPSMNTASHIQGQAVATTTPQSGQVLTYSGTEWVPFTLTTTSNGSGTLAVAIGGTGVSSFTNNGVLVGAGAGPVSATAAGPTSSVLTVGAGGPEFGQVNLESSAAVTGILPATKGGTGVNSTAIFPSDGVVVTRDSTEILTNKTVTGATINGASSIAGSTEINTAGSLTAATVTSQGNITVRGDGTNANKIMLTDKDNSNYVAFKAPDTLTTQLTWELPSTDGASGQVLSTNGSGTLSWRSDVGPTGVASGDLTGNFPGPTLAPVGTAGTYMKVTTDSKGRVISGETLNPSDLPPINASSLSTGMLAVANGGTGVGSFTNNGVVIGSSSALSSTAAGTQYSVLTVDTNNQPTFGKVNLASPNAVEGALGLVNGGTGSTTKSGAFDALSPMNAAGDLIYGGTSGNGTKLAGNTTSNKQFLSSTGTGSAANAPVWAALTAADIPDHSAALITSGTLGTVNGGTGAGTTTANFVFAGPTSGSGAPSFRPLVAGDFPAMIGANGTTAGTAGAVPEPTATDNVKFLRGDGTWASLASAAAGSNNQIQYNSGGALAGTANFVYLNGNVGIGTTAPSTGLDVRAGSNSLGHIRVGSTGNAGAIRFARGTDGSYQGWIGFSGPSDSSILQFGNATGWGSLSWWASGAEKMRLTGTGSLGIGTTDPARPVEIYQNVAGAEAQALRLTNYGNNGTANSNVALEFRAANQPAPAKIVGIGPGFQHQLLAFYTANGGVQNSTPALYLDQNNNVGIGTTNPQAKLQINGQVATTLVTDTTLAMDMAAGNFHSNNVAAGTLVLNNMIDATTYTVMLTNETGGNYLLSGSSVSSWRCSPACTSATVTVTAGSHTVLSITKVGTTAYVFWDNSL